MASEQNERRAAGTSGAPVASLRLFGVTEPTAAAAAAAVHSAFSYPDDNGC